jgi:mannose-6-phosphate isomerase
MQNEALYPLRFEPIYQYRLWGGRRLSNLLSAPLPGDGPIGEAWLLSDRDDHPSLVADGTLKGQTIRQLLEQFPKQLLGEHSGHLRRFPLLLKFLDVNTRLSVQVHPSDADSELIPPGDTGKTEAWVVLEKGPEARIYAGLKTAGSEEVLRRAIACGTLPDRLASFTPKIGDGVLIPAGSVHSLGDVVVFEAQQNSDVTFRLYDWDHVDPETGRSRPLQVEQAMACIDFKQSAIAPVSPLVEAREPVLRERLVQCDHFNLTRISGKVCFPVGVAGRPRALVCLAGSGQLQHAESRYEFNKGNAWLLPAAVGACACLPHGLVSVLEISLPEVK